MKRTQIAKVLAALMIMSLGSFTGLTNEFTGIQEVSAAEESDSVKEPGVVEVGDLSYRLNENDSTASVVKYSGTNESVDISNNIEVGGKTYTVKSIEYGCFLDCTSLVKVNIPDTVDDLSSFTFWGCNNLEEVKLPSGLKKFGGYNFWKCKNLKHIDVPETLEEIGQGTFDDSGLESIVLPKGIKTIERYALSGTNIRSIDVPDSVNTLETDAFAGCKELEKVNLPESLRYIDSYAFASCKSLKTIKLPESLYSLGEGAFKYCSALKSIEVPSRVYEIGSETFEGCKKLSTIKFDNKDLYFRGRVGYTQFDDCSNIKNIICYSDKVIDGIKKIKDCSDYFRVELKSNDYNELQLVKKGKSIIYDKEKYKLCKEDGSLVTSNKVTSNETYLLINK